jgi:phosphoribosylaminoimidazolecarboxamide formyltransferase/IMP cyclohydrolase
MAFNVVDRAPDRVAVRNVLISVFDKSGLEDLIGGLVSACPEVRFYSTGGTYRKLSQLLPDRSRLHAVTDYTGQSEMQGGLVKTLDFKIYLGLLSEPYNDAHDADLRRTGAVPFDLTVVNLYPFRRVVSHNADVETARGNIDIGGPSMLRASAKNFIRVATLCDPEDYGAVVAELGSNGGTLGIRTRFRLARKAFDHTAAYDAAIASFLSDKTSDDLPYSIQE